MQDYLDVKISDMGGLSDDMQALIKDMAFEAQKIRMLFRELRNLFKCVMQEEHIFQRGCYLLEACIDLLVHDHQCATSYTEAEHD